MLFAYIKREGKAIRIKNLQDLKKVKAQIFATMISMTGAISHQNYYFTFPSFRLTTTISVSSS